MLYKLNSIQKNPVRTPYREREQESESVYAQGFQDEMPNMRI